MPEPIETSLPKALRAYRCETSPHKMHARNPALFSNWECTYCGERLHADHQRNCYYAAFVYIIHEVP